MNTSIGEPFELFSAWKVRQCWCCAILYGVAEGAKDLQAADI